MSDDEERPVDDATGTRTTGHTWDGIGELDTPLPRWWLWIFYATIIWAIGYMIAYPAIPLLNGGSSGLLGWNSRTAVEQEIDSVAQARETLDVQIASMSFDEIEDHPELMDYARRSGASAFKLVCSQCHGSGGAGDQQLGYPNLNDDAWLWGGTKDDLFHTISHGVRNDQDPLARASVMPAYLELGILQPKDIGDVAHYVLAISGQDHDAERAALGATTFAQQCAACHGVEGEGNHLLGAPRLNDAIWLYGGSYDQIVAQIGNPQMGNMPPWNERFSEAQLKKLAIYVHSLGGGN